MNVTYDFSDKVALVTGASKGMGASAARAFAKAGAAVVVSDVDEDSLAAIAKELEADGARVLSVVCDVADDAAVGEMIDRTVQTFGTLDYAYNNAGVPPVPAEMADQTPEEFERVTGINQRGVWSCMRHELRVMREKGSGAIVNCSSVGGLVGGKALGIYYGTKHGVLGLTKSAAMDYAAQGIRVNAVCPGTIQTPMVQKMLDEQPEAMDEFMQMQAIGRLGQPEEIAQAVMWLCSDGASFVTGAALAVDGAFTAN
ncbi:glucose 1-dehydrogenase [Croceicoccus gelatinilyticus]|uniref:glucose 1-dehydrogenase n=1 Tax=Croceicoccus gelatinilyticus TaxID=2835536 RepID=UPI001BD1687A|nr:glucose 1-dehydrogenase [Croceicoccus gelatinilyticus]MBS7668798.1 glucose 1-dehydrogenase [Croceicoccus gelatinilyticus]